MIVTCTRCGNSYVVDDNIYTNQGGYGMCEQCAVPLMPAHTGDAGFQQAYSEWDSAPDAMREGEDRPQYINNSESTIALDLDTVLGKDGMTSLQPAEFSMYTNQTQLKPTQVMPEAPYGQYPGGYAGTDYRYDDRNAGYGYGMPDYNQNFGGAQGYAQQDINARNQVSFAPGYPNAGYPQAYPYDERAAYAAPLRATVPNDDWGNQAWGDVTEQNEKVKEPAAANRIVVGNAVSPEANHEATFAVPLEELVRQRERDYVKTTVNNFRQIPLPIVIGVGALIAILFLSVIIVGIYKLQSSPDTPASPVSQNEPEIINDPVQADDAVLEKTFREHYAEASEKIETLLTIDGPEITDGIVLTVTYNDGVYLNGQKVIATTPETTTDDEIGSAYTNKLAKAIEKIENDVVVIFIDGALKSRTLYRILYTAMSTGKEVFIAGKNIDRQNRNPAILQVLNHEWPTPPNNRKFPQQPYTSMRIEVKQDYLGITGEKVNAEKGDPNKVVIQSIGGPYDFDTYRRVMAHNQEKKAVIVNVDGKISVERFLGVVQRTYNEERSPWFNKILLEQVE